MAYETLKIEHQGKVAVLTLNRPAALNALTATMAAELRSVFTSLSESDVRAMVLTGEGRAFCAGGDLKDMQRVASESGKADAFFDEPLRILHEAVLMFRTADFPIVAAVNGVAFGAGCNFALACDLVVAGTTARFGQAFVNVGLTPDCGGTFILPRLVGMKRAAYMLMTGEPIEAAQAFAIGMINFVVPDDEVMDRAMALATRLAAGPPSAIVRIKKLLDMSATRDWAEQLEEERRSQMISGQSMEFKEGVTAFIQKRPPDFAGT